MYNLLVVESPNKAQTITGYLKELPERWEVFATGGHFKDLTEEYGVERKEDGFNAKWKIPDHKKKTAHELKRKSSGAAEVFLALDDDREGEGIALDVVKYTKITNYKRIIFPDLGKKTVLKTLAAKEESRPLDLNIAKAREERRILDRIIGYRMSGIIRHDFKHRGIPYKTEGIGRVSFAALSLLVTQQELIDAFVAEERTKIFVEYGYKGETFSCYLTEDFSTENDYKKILEISNTLRTTPHLITNFKEVTKDKLPPPPIIAATLLSSAFNLFRIKPKQAAKIAQELFEGIEINGIRVPLLTYPRTDSYRINPDTIIDINELIHNLVLDQKKGPLGERYVFEGQRPFKPRKNAQEAHEAIRPISFEKGMWPKKLKGYLAEEQFLIYRYVWAATVVTQMANSRYRAAKIEITCGDHILLGESEERRFDGWEVLEPYLTKPKDEMTPKRSNRIPAVRIGEEIESKLVASTSRFTQTPDRFGEGRFIQTLASKNIGRPSTYPEIASDLIEKKYVETTEDDMLIPTKTGRAIVLWAREMCPWLIDENHAREFEEKLAIVERGESGVKDELVREYDDLVSELMGRVGYTPNDNPEPSEKEVGYAKKLAEKRGEDIGAILDDKKKLKGYIKKSLKESTLHTCPECGKGEIRENDASYSCSNYENCEMKIWKEGAKRFFKNFGQPMEDDDIREIVTAALKKRYLVVKNLHGKSSSFNAKIGIKKDDKFGWGLDIKEFVPPEKLGEERVFKRKVDMGSAHTA